MTSTGTHPAMRARVRAVAALLPAVAFAFAFRSLCYAAMTALALWNERRPAPTLPDLVLSHVPYIPWVSRLNYLAWLLLYMPIAFALLFTEPRRWVRYMVTGWLGGHGVQQLLQFRPAG
ncbi:MAG: hypothetical protein WCJ30_20145, partial [Deltaproteobacteria bacterium]